MKGGSWEAKGHKSTRDGRTWHGKREILTPCPPPLHMYSLIHVIIISYLGLLEIETLHLSPQPLNYLVGLRAVSSIQPLCSVWHMTINTSSNNHI